MTQRSTHHEDLSPLLPFYVNGTLTQEERATVEEAMAQDASLRHEAEVLAEMRETWQALPEDEHSPGEAGLQRLLAEISAEAAPAGPKTPLPQPANTNAPVLKRLAALAAAAAFGALLGTSALLTMEETTGAQMVSGGSGFIDDVPTIAVSFRSGVSLGDISDALREFGLTVVDGPSAVGLYRVARFDGGSLSEDDAEDLRARADIFEMVDDPQ